MSRTKETVRPARPRSGRHEGRRINRRPAIALLASAVCAVGLATVGGTGASVAGERQNVPSLNGRVIAFGIPGASAISPVGRFLPGSPINSNPELAALTQPGRVMDPIRFVVGGRSNFGAPKANADQAEGSFLSIDPRGSNLAVPPGFASSGDQASVLGGAVQMYSAQSPFWRNGVYTPTAVTADQTAVANPLGMSINNAFGRLWPANAPYGLRGPGSSSIADPDGRPLKGAPNQTTGGVYFGDLTGRQPTQVIPGALSKAAVGTALLGRSPDGSTRAVFAVVVADGSIVQEHTAKALDGIAPPGTVQPLANRSWRDDHDDDDDDDDGNRGRGVLPRLGAIVNYDPQLTLYVSQPFSDSIMAIDLTTGGPAGNEVFMPGTTRVIRSRVLDQPLDLAPVQIDTTHPDHASNTTMQPGSDFYVCNRGNDTIVRMRQDGTVVAVRKVRVGNRSLGQARLNGIATSSDGSKIWITYVGKLPGSRDRLGGVLELPAF
jgi:hypothetical protein